MALENNNLDIGITMSDIDKLLNELKIETSLLRKRKEEIERNPDLLVKSQELINFRILTEIYVLPLSEMANRLSLHYNQQPICFPNLDNYSIIGQVMTIRNFLLSKGCSLETIVKLIPKSKEEVNIFVLAYHNGFSLEFLPNQTLYNEDRLKRAKDHLEQLKKDDINGKLK